MPVTVYTYLLIVNIVAFLAYGVDKYKATKKAWRIPESTLIALAAVGGALGAFLAMRFFRHKTQHHKFTILVPILIAVWVMALYCLQGH